MKNIKTKTLITLFLTIFITACGPSLEERKDIAKVTCNIMGESRNMDSYLRIKEINAARKELGEDPFLKNDSEIKESFEYGLCETLVAFPEEYADQLARAKQLEQKRLAEERRLEQKRLAEERRKKINEEKERLQRISGPLEEWKSEILKRIGIVPEPIEDVVFDVSYSDANPLDLVYVCRGFKNLSSTFTITFSNELGSLLARNSTGFCISGSHNERIKVDENVLEKLYKIIGSRKEGSLMRFVKTIDVEIVHTLPSQFIPFGEKAAYKYVDPTNFHPDLTRKDLFENPIKLRIYENKDIKSFK